MVEIPRLAAATPLASPPVVVATPGNQAMKVWHDDIRPPPEGWLWVRTNTEAIAVLSAYPNIEEISLDHDLGLEDLPPAATVEEMAFAGRSNNGSGLDLVHWMIQHKLVPPKVRIHSWNPDGARAMAAALNRAGHDCVVSPFKAA